MEILFNYINIFKINILTPYISNIYYISIYFEHI